MIDIREYDVKALAYIGDAVYELYVRRHIMENSHEQVSKLHKKAVKYVSAKAQAYIIEKIMDNLTAEEQAIFKRGRNAPANTVPKNTDVIVYKIATGFEAVVGYLYLTGDAKLDGFLKEAIGVIDEHLNCNR